MNVPQTRNKAASEGFDMYIVCPLQDYQCLAGLTNLRRLEMFQDWPPNLDDDVLHGHNGDQPLTELEEQRLAEVLHGMSQLTWLNLPMSKAVNPVLPLLSKVPALEQLFLQVSLIQTVFVQSIMLSSYDICIFQ